MSRFLAVFVKNPLPGRVKTRLHRRYAPPQAAELYRAFVQDCLDACRGVDADHRVICYDPPDAGSQIKPLAGSGWELRPQCPGDLGGRMSEAFDWSFARGASRTVLLGSDAPSLPAEYVQQAFESLGRADLVLGPSTDGGYYLIGLSAPRPELFSDIDWGTGRVLAATLERATGLSMALIPLWYDVDTPEDLDLLVAHTTGLRMSGHAEAAIHTRRCVSKLHERCQDAPTK